MAHNPLVSIVVPAHNAEVTLARALDCLLDQEIVDWEAIIVDDASTDRTPAIIAGYVERDARFRTLSSCAHSAAGARNSGISTARGHWLMFLDADDWVDASFLAKMLAALKTAPDAVAAYCGSRRVMPDGELTPSSISTEVAIQPFETFARRCAIAHSRAAGRPGDNCRVGRFRCVAAHLRGLGSVAAPRTSGQKLGDGRRAARFLSGQPQLALPQFDADAGRCGNRDRPRLFSDPRVKHPASAHANGAISANGGTASEALAWFALWNAASDCGCGSRSIDPQSLRALPAGRKWAREIAKVAVDGLMVGSLSVPAQLAARWDRFGGAITELIIELGKVWDNPVAARRVQYHLEQMLLDVDDLAAPRRLARTLGIRVDARNPTSIELPEGIDQIYAYLMMDGQIEAVVQFGVLGTVTRDHWIELILNVVPPERLAPQEGAGADKSNMLAAEALLSTAERRSDPDSHFGKLAQLAAEARGLVRSSAEASRASCSAAPSTGRGWQE